VTELEKLKQKYRDHLEEVAEAEAGKRHYDRASIAYQLLTQIEQATTVAEVLALMGIE